MRTTTRWRTNDASVRIATTLLPRQLFLLRTPEGTQVEVQLVDSGVAIQNSQIVTVVWAAPAGSRHGFAVFVRNHSTGASARLKANVRRLRPPIPVSRILPLGGLAALPAILAIFAWLLSPASLTGLNTGFFLLVAIVGVVLLFALGAIVTKVAFDYLRSEDEDRIWIAVEAAIADGNRRFNAQNARRSYGS